MERGKGERESIKQISKKDEGLLNVWRDRQTVGMKKGWEGNLETCSW